jgi:hypothetical protein
MSNIERNEKAALMARAQLPSTNLEAAFIDLEAQPLPKQSCKCTRKALEAIPPLRVDILTFLAGLLAMFIMNILLMITCVATLYEATLPQKNFDFADLFADPGQQKVMLILAAACFPANIMAYYAARGFMYACGVTQSNVYYTYVVPLLLWAIANYYLQS